MGNLASTSTPVWVKRRRQEEANYVRLINSDFRKVDQSHLWPISGRFNVTERAIRRLAKQRVLSGVEFGNYEKVLEQEISALVNQAV